MQMSSNKFWVHNVYHVKYGREYFEEVDRTWETFEHTLWSHISNFFELAKERYANLHMYPSLSYFVYLNLEF